jgi:hypothetical protein
VIVHLERHEGPPRVVEVALPMAGRDGPFALSTLACFECDRFRHFPVSARIAARLRAKGEPIPASFCEERFGRVR